MSEPDVLDAERLAAFGTVSTRLALLSDHRIRDLLATGTPLGSGIGGRAVELYVEGVGVRVFAKRVPLTDVELRPENRRSTANVFRLPLFYQYGAGSAGFGAWRELAAHVMTTNWALQNAYQGFPLLYHWRVLPDSPPRGFADAFGGVAGAVAHWEGAQAVRGRLDAVGRSRFSLVLFLEHVPYTLAAWLERRDAVSSQDGDDGSRLVWAERELRHGTAFLRSRRLVHFDAHFENVLTDGRRLYFADFGLALSGEFDLGGDERRFLAGHLAYDHCHTASHLLRHHLLGHRLLRRHVCDGVPDGVSDGARGGGGTEREDFLRDWVGGRRPDGIRPDLAAIIDRHARPALVLDAFHRRFLTESKRTPFPAAEIERALHAGGGAD